ncbi:uncharacterized protein LTR77_009185 [Saxophila tyrrhenica]|uniref:MmgE/PrpD N-terminal domain-containing protein n=1 Tax=Saxophila tyrrhenica TaxID=1690608 RepID=A0AAV9NZ47_9PEZI|nr:hypothetical protein LTR77_009185 [Saxophila tyrrhenica]
MNATTANYTAEIAAFAANATVSTIPTAFLTLLSIYFLDTFAAMLAGSVQPVYHSAAKAIRFTHGLGSPDASYTALDGMNTSLSGQMFLMGLAAGDFEFEHTIEGATPASSVFPALLSLSAAYNKTGEEFLAAMAVGYELATRIAAATTLEVEDVLGFHPAGLGSPAAAAAVGTLLQWDADTIASGMGIAVNSASGLVDYLSTGADTRNTHAARAGQLGVEAALMAKAGVQGSKDIFENPEG